MDPDHLTKRTTNQNSEIILVLITDLFYCDILFTKIYLSLFSAMIQIVTIDENNQNSNDSTITNQSEHRSNDL